MKTITVQPNQSMQDVVLTACGTLEGAMAFCRANDVSISDVPAPGTVYVVPEGITTEPAILQLMADRRIVPGTLAQELEPAGLVMTVLLRALMDVALVEDELLVQYDLIWSEAEAFVNVNELVALASAPTLYTNLKSVWDTGDTGTVGVTADVYSVGLLEFNAGTAFLTTEQYMWYCLGGLRTASFRDVEGNEAVYVPFIVYIPGDEVLVTMIGELDVLQGATVGGGMELLVSVGHGDMAEGWAIMGYTMRVIDGDGAPVYAGEVTAGVTAVVVGAGVYEVLLTTVYESDGVGAGVGPYSFISMVLNIA